jgi:hypothetical protein
MCIIMLSYEDPQFSQNNNPHKSCQYMRSHSSHKHTGLSHCRGMKKIKAVNSKRASDSSSFLQIAIIIIIVAAVHNWSFFFAH